MATVANKDDCASHLINGFLGVARIRLRLSRGTLAHSTAEWSAMAIHGHPTFLANPTTSRQGSKNRTTLAGSHFLWLDALLWICNLGRIRG